MPKTFPFNFVPNNAAFLEVETISFSEKIHSSFGLNKLRSARFPYSIECIGIRNVSFSTVRVLIVVSRSKTLFNAPKQLSNPILP